MVGALTLVRRLSAAQQVLQNLTSQATNNDCWFFLTDCWFFYTV
jgi:hypothetical protein